MGLFGRKRKSARDYGAATLERGTAPRQPVSPAINWFSIPDRAREEAPVQAPLGLSAEQRLDRTEKLQAKKHQTEKRDADWLHKAEMKLLDIELKSLMAAKTNPEAEGQRKLARRLKENLKDNRIKLRATENEIKEVRRYAKNLEGQLTGFKDELFDKAVQMDAQRRKIRELRDTIVQSRTRIGRAHSEAAAEPLQFSINNLKSKLFETHNRLDALLYENGELKTENTELKRENTDLKIQISDLEAQREARQQTEAARPANTADIEKLHHDLTESRAREALLEQRLEIVKQDLDIVTQINDMLKKRGLDSRPSGSDTVIRQVAGF